LQNIQQYTLLPDILFHEKQVLFEKNERYSSFFEKIKCNVKIICVQYKKNER